MNVSAAERWFDQKIADYGAQLFQKNCTVCHGANAEGTRDWKKRMQMAIILHHH
ncbi:MAG: c-type cytochrome [Gammaproteobacteria bacterium]|nr:c-type cytochrome [Gammaproteobacteria bacterium]